MILIAPSRGRPSRAKTMRDSALGTAEGDVRVVVAVDPDEPFLDAYERSIPDLIVLSDRIGYGATLNLVARAEWDDHDILGAFGDDVIFRTPGWDTMVRDTLATPGIAYPNDLAHGEVHGTAVFMSSVIAKALGWLALPNCWHQYIDNAWMDVGKEAGVLTYLPQVVVEHMHEVYGKAENDATYQSVYSEPQASIDRAAFLSWKHAGIQSDAAKIRAAL